jgi:hypothetical protein
MPACAGMTIRSERAKRTLQILLLAHTAIANAHA